MFEFLSGKSLKERVKVFNPDEAKFPTGWNVPGSPMMITIEEKVIANEVDFEDTVFLVTIHCGGARVLVKLKEVEDDE